MADEEQECPHGDIGPHWCEEPPEMVPQSFVDGVRLLSDALSKVTPEFLAHVPVMSLDDLPACLEARAKAAGEEAPSA